ncbi:ADP-dependent NAD(P)H-hydrate dehydratase [Microbacterium sp.]|uniref:ADP-dependent NAD(P)H-hydrate dehydratase n=1 Tax=Microbacterium sp. TaxID=51671 RepID=UPI0039E37354
MTAPAAEWTARDAAACLRRPRPEDDKYRRGVLGIRTGSEAYPGAAVLGVEAAHRTGIGMVRYLGPATATGLVLQRRPETVTADGRVQAWVIGSGTDAAARTPAETAALRGILSGDVPVVVDAGALDLAVGATAPMVVTPHAGEHARLRARLGLPDVTEPSEAARTEAAWETARALGATVLLKGAVTIVATPSGWTRLVVAGTPWLATAGTGDVLAGAIGALVAAACGPMGAPGTRHAPTGAAGPLAGDRVGSVDAEELGRLAATGALLHGRAGRLAADTLGPVGGPITALDVAAALPRAVGELLGGLAG